MRKQIAAANWKMNLTYQQGEKLLDDILGAEVELASHQLAIFAVPYPYLLMARSEVEEELPGLDGRRPRVRSEGRHHQHRRRCRVSVRIVVRLRHHART